MFDRNTFNLLLMIYQLQRDIVLIKFKIWNHHYLLATYGCQIYRNQLEMQGSIYSKTVQDRTHPEVKRSYWVTELLICRIEVSA